MQSNQKKIIIVDDNAANLAVGRNLLKSYYEVFPVPSAAKLFDVLEKFIPDLILLDVNMPEMNGYEAIKLLKANERFADIPVIFLTAKSDEESELEGFDLGAADYVTKPFSGPLLLRRIASQLLLEQQKQDLIVSHDALQDYAENLELKVREKTAAKTIFLANMSHELRTPMNSIVGFSELALDDDISLRTRGYLAEILESSEWLLHIINDILDITSIESGKIEMNEVVFDLYEVIEDCKKMFLTKATEKGLMLNFYSDPSLKNSLIGDPARLRQVLINLLSNAVKFTSSGVVEFQMDVKGIEDDTAILFFEVKDTGIGMTSEQISIIYDPFTQVDSGNTKKYGGTGLGLTITKSIVEMMGGAIDLDSTPGVGSTFSFEAKFKIVKPDTETSEISGVFFGSKRPTFDGEILLCEDNSMNQQVACEHLAKLGFKTVVAENGKIGVEFVRDRLAHKAKLFDLIFMDIHMPVMDGLEATEEILKLTTDIPILALTANIMPDDINMYLKTGMKECLGKPFTSHDLWSCLLRYLEPVSWHYEDLGETQRAELELRQKLINKFVRRNRDAVTDIIKALDSGDVTLAHRIVHTLKSNAAQLDKKHLRQAANDLEHCLKDGMNLASPHHITALDIELKTVMKEFESQVQETAACADQLDDAGALELMDKLEPMIAEGDVDCMSFVDDLQSIPGSEELIRSMEDFDFKLAYVSLKKLRENFDGNGN